MPQWTLRLNYRSGICGIHRLEPPGSLSLAYAKDLEQTADRPIARLTIQADQITREDLWPEPDDIGRVVILPGGEVGKLLSWWNAEDGSEWRWQVEFYNHR